MPKKFYKPYRETPVDRDRLLELLEYHSETGEFTWKVTRGRAKAGATAGCLTNTHSKPQLTIRFDGRCYPSHYLAWIYAYGSEPTYRLGWRDGNRLNNAITNLYEDSDDFGTGIDDMTGVYSHPNGQFMAVVFDPVERQNVTLGFFSRPKAAWMSRQGALKRIEVGEPINPYKAPRKESKHGRGIQPSENGEKFVAYIYDKNAGKNVRLGTFETTEGATMARQSAARRIEAGFFAKQYIP